MKRFHCKGHSLHRDYCSIPVLFYSSGDPLSNMVLTFDTKEEAIAYAVKNGTWYKVYMVSPRHPYFHYRLGL